MYVLYNMHVLLQDEFFAQVLYVVFCSCSSVKVWDSSWNLVCTFVGHSGCVTSLTPHPYGPMIVSGSTDTSLRVWNLSLCDQVEM